MHLSSTRLHVYLLPHTAHRLDLMGSYNRQLEATDKQVEQAEAALAELSPHSRTVAGCLLFVCT